MALSLAGLAACGDDEDERRWRRRRQNLSGTIRIDGSSTVGPLSEAAAEGFQGENPDVKVTVGTSGTGGGFEKFCAGETDISDASRPIKDDEEVPVCEKNGVEYNEIQVANDGIALVVNPENDWAECLTVDQLKKIWDKGSSVKNWKDVDPKFPDEEIKLFGAGTDSGTFDFFTAEINGEEGNSRTDYSATEDDNVTVQGVAGEKGGARLLRPLVRGAEQGQDQGGPGRRRRRAASSRPRRRSRAASTSRSRARSSSTRASRPRRGPRSRRSSTSTSRTRSTSPTRRSSCP